MMERRTFIASLPMIAAATGVKAYQVPDAPVQDQPELPEWWRKLTAMSDSEKINFHADELSRLVRESAPEGMGKPGDVIIFTNGSVMSHAFPVGFDSGQEYAVFANGAWGRKV